VLVVVVGVVVAAVAQRQSPPATGAIALKRVGDEDVFGMNRKRSAFLGQMTDIFSGGHRETSDSGDVESTAQILSSMSV